MIYKYIFLFRVAMQNTFKQRTRALLALGSISLSVGVMVVLFGVGIGLQKLVLSAIGGANTKDVVTITPRGNQAIKLNQEKVSAIKSLTGVSTVEEMVGLVGKMNYHGTDLSLPTYAVSSGYFDLSAEDVAVGDLRQLQTGTDNVVINLGAVQAFDAKASDMHNNPVKLSIDIDKTLAEKQQEDVLTLPVTEYKVRGVIKKANAPVAYIPIETVRTRGVTTLSQLKIRLSSSVKVKEVRQNIEEMGFQTSSIQDSIDEVNRIFSVIQKILVIFGIITLVVTIFSTFNTISLTLIEETPQIGFLRIIGMHWRDVGYMFIAQAVALTTIGATIGIIGGCLIGELINGITQTTANDNSASSSVYIFQIPIVQIIIMLMLSILLGWLIGLMPAKRAVKIGPIEALRS